jgi:hypothetical protein
VLALLDVTLRPLVMDMMMKKKNRDVNDLPTKWIWHMLSKDDVVDAPTEDKLPAMMKHVLFRWVRFCQTNQNAAIIHEYLQLKSCKLYSDQFGFLPILGQWLDLQIDYGMRNTQYLQRIGVYLSTPQPLKYPLVIHKIIECKCMYSIDEKTRVLQEHATCTVECDDGSTCTLHVPVEQWIEWRNEVKSFQAAVQLHKQTHKQSQ